jgi:hypothetical protein
MKWWENEPYITSTTHPTQLCQHIWDHCDTCEQTWTSQFAKPRNATRLSRSSGGCQKGRDNWSFPIEMQKQLFVCFCFSHLVTNSPNLGVICWGECTNITSQSSQSSPCLYIKIRRTQLDILLQPSGAAGRYEKWCMEWHRFGGSS